MNASKYLKLAAVVVPVFLSACRGQTSKKSPIFHWNLNMDQQKRFEGQERNPFFEDNRSMRQPVKGTIPQRRGLRTFSGLYYTTDIDSSSFSDKVLYQGINDDSSFVKTNPIKLTKKFLLHGQNRFNVYCTPCHGYAGDGKGIVMTGHYGFVPAPTYHQARLRNVGDGYIYSVITNGIRNMPSYAHQIPVRDRWAIVAYVRALQKSQNVNESEVNKFNIDLASLKEKARQKIKDQQAQKKAQAAASSGTAITAAQGEKLAQENACATCHSTDGSKMTGPTWKNLYGSTVTLESGKTVTANDDYLTESIVNSTAKVVKGYQPVMPNFSYLGANDVKSLIAYIKSLSNKGGTGSSADSSNTDSSATQ